MITAALQFARKIRSVIYLACGQQNEEGRAGFPRRVNRGWSRLLSRDLNMVQREYGSTCVAI